MTLTDQDTALCIAALTQAAKELMEGYEAGHRLGTPTNSPTLQRMLETADRMAKLKDRMMSNG